MSSASDSGCLVARAIPLPEKKNDSSLISAADALADQLDAALSLDAKKGKEAEEEEALKKKKSKAPRREETNISPADHLALQSLRSSAMARKTNTTTKFSRDCRNLFADLMLGGEEEEKEKKKKEEEKVEKKEKKEEEEKKTKKEEETKKNGEKVKVKAEEKKTEKKEEKNEEGSVEKKEEDEEVMLLARGPIRAPMIGRAAPSAAHFHPYPSALPASSSAAAFVPPVEMLFVPSAAPFNAAAPQSAMRDQSSYNPMAAAGYGYDCGLPSNWSCGGWSAGRDSVLSSPSTTPDTTLGSVMSPGGQSERSELPDDLSDFILEYSRRYSPTLSRKHSVGSDGDCGASPRSNASDEEQQACLTGGGNSPLCAPQTSPAAPRAVGSRTPTYNDISTVTTKGLMMLGTGNGGEERARPAKERLKALIRSDDMDDAWAWTCKCIQYHPEALTFQDGDGDTLLHIVTGHLDLAKIYALVEQMLKANNAQQMHSSHLPIDVPNRVGETPLMVAIQKGRTEVVEYLLEAGASPNTQSSRMERDMPLHYAAARGMGSIVSALCACQSADLNAPNGMGLSPLLNAFKSHSQIEEESQMAVNNLDTVKVLVKAGADVRVADATNGKTLIHYAVEKGDPELIELLRANVEEQRMTELVNQADFCGETPIRTLEGIARAGMMDAEKKGQLCLALITCGAKAQ